jgi:tellurite resistance protein TerC
MIALWVKSIRQAKRIIIGIMGFTVLAIGLVMVVLPGPAFIVIPLGLGILATEFVWARNLMKRIRSKFQGKSKSKNKIEIE